MKGIAFNTIIFASIAIASVVIFLMILNSIIPNFMGRALCKVYQIVLSLPLPRQLKPNIPGCSLFPTMKRVVLEEGLSNANILTNYVVDCWKDSQEGRGGQTFICYELFMEKVPDSFGGPDVISLLRARGFDENKINWKIGIIQGNELTVIIKYNSESGQIEVI